jgi:hypothetical protein
VLRMGAWRLRGIVGNRGDDGERNGYCRSSLWDLRYICIIQTDAVLFGQLSGRFALADVTDFGPQPDYVPPAFTGSEVGADAGIEVCLAGIARPALQGAADILPAVFPAAGKQIRDYCIQTRMQGFLESFKDVGAHFLAPARSRSVSRVLMERAAK